jgi:membrane protease YdiL (CAAX protease family)
MNKKGKFSTLMGTERAKGLITVILYIVLLTLSPFLAFVLLQAFRAITGIFDEDLFNRLLTWAPFVIALAVFVVIYRKRLKDDAQRLTRKNIYFIIVMAVIVLILNQASNAVIDAFSFSDASNIAPVNDLLSANVVFGLIVTVVYGPVVEELVFRKGIDQIIGDKIPGSKIIFVVISALSFALVHDTNINAISYIIMGAIYAIGYLKTDKNVIAAIALHFINNLVFTLFMYFGIFQ